jgi:hypothetical protein
VFLGFTYPIIAQVPEIDETQPTEELSLSKDKIPDVIKQAVQKDFVNGEPVKWGIFPQVLQEYGWVVDKSSNSATDFYEVYIKTKDGSDMFAIYSKDGKLLRSKEVIKNLPLPQAVRTALANSEYKDWTIKGDVAKVTDYKNKVSVHYIVKVTKNNKVHNLYFDENGKRLMNKLV